MKSEQGESEQGGGYEVESKGGRIIRGKVRRKGVSGSLGLHSSVTLFSYKSVE